MTQRPSRPDDLDPEVEAPLDAIEGAPSSGAMRILVKDSLVLPLEAGPPPASGATPFLHGVQQKLRRRSRGKFFGDAWSTGRSLQTYGLVALAMLVVLAVAYVLLGPAGIHSG